MPTWMRRLSFGLGALLLLGAPAVWYLAQPAASSGELPAEFLIGAADDAPDDADTPEQLPDAAVATDPAQDLDTAPDPAPAPPAEPVVDRPAKPVGLSVPSIGLETTDLVEVQLDENRAVEIPEDVRQVGWYRRGPRPGEPGNAFMTSHVDSRTQGRGVLFDLRLSEPGDPITVTHEDGATSEWVVVARERYNKGEYPLEQVFRFDGPPGLVIDTCGGRFDPTTGSYEDIVTVYAVPADSDAAAAVT